MRKQRRARAGVAMVCGAAAVFAAWAVACSGSDSQDVVSAPDTGPEVGHDTSLPDTSLPDVVTDVVKDTGPIYDAGQPNVLDSGDFEGGIPCVVGGVLEQESNDDKASANTAAPTVCGVVGEGAGDGGDAGDGGGDVSDFVTFTLMPTTKSFYIQFAGNVSLKVDVEGSPSVTITPTMSGNVPLVKDKPYYIEVRSLNGKPATWRVTIFES